MVQTDRLACEVLVVGGGVSGTLAAVSASRSGAETLLIEKRPWLGGAPGIGFHRFICGLYLNGPDPPKDILNHGLATEVVERLRRAGACDETALRMGRVFVLPFSFEGFQRVYEELIAAEKALSLHRSTEIAGVRVVDGLVTSVSVIAGERRLEIDARAVVDATGEGAVLRMAGIPFELSRPEDLPWAGFSVMLTRIPIEDAALPIRVPYELNRAVKEGKLLGSSKFTTFTPGHREGTGILKLSVDPSEPEPMRTENARELAMKVWAHLSSAIPAFRGARIDGMSLQVMDREGARLCGAYTLTEEDVLEGRKFQDGIAQGAWPIEFWSRSRGPTYRYPPDGEYYEISARCLSASGMPNLFCGGRCISASSPGVGSIRVMGTCMALGAAAGREASDWVRAPKEVQT